jgi:hypothetical protein
MLLAGSVAVPGRSDVTDEFGQLRKVANLAAGVRLPEIGDSRNACGGQFSIQAVRVHL